MKPKQTLADILGTIDHKAVMPRARLDRFANLPCAVLNA
jgi:hypothetical protein